MLDFSPFCDTGQSVRDRRRKVDLSSAGELVRLVKFYFSVEVNTSPTITTLDSLSPLTARLQLIKF